MSSMTPALLVACGVLLAACANPNEACLQQQASCITRCEAATNNRDLARNALPPENTTTECERHCACRDREPAAPKAQGRPTLTGNAP